jgi:hypothetical protein
VDQRHGNAAGLGGGQRQHPRTDRVGRAATLRLTLAAGAVACIAAVAARPDDAALLLALAAAAGVAAGGSHVAAALLLELVRGRRYRALVLLSFPALFFPVALAERAIESAGWARATAATLAVCTLAGAGLMCLPESPAFLKARAAAAAAAAAATGSPARAPALIDVLEAEDGGTSDDVDESSLDGLPEGHVSASAPPGFGLGDAVLTPAAERRLLLQRCSRRLHVERGTIVTAAIWLLLTPSIYLSSMVSYLDRYN